MIAFLKMFISLVAVAKVQGFLLSPNARGIQRLLSTKGGEDKSKQVSSTSMKRGDLKKSRQSAISPYFKVKDWELASPLMKVKTISMRVLRQEEPMLPTKYRCHQEFDRIAEKLDMPSFGRRQLGL